MGKRIPLTVISNMAWIPKAEVDMKAVKRNYAHRFYEESACARCEHLEERHSEEFCDPCPNFKETVNTYRVVEKKGRTYVGLPIGDKRNYRKHAGVSPSTFRKEAMVDKRPYPKAQAKIEFTGKLHDYQEPTVEEWLDAGYGLLKAPPRTGKTVMVTYIACKLRRVTIILAHQIDLLKQFKETFDNLTDHQDEAFRLKRDVVGIARTIDQLMQYDVCLVTYQSFLSWMGKKRLKKIAKRFGLVFVDEVHKVGASEFAKVVNSFNARKKGGVTATVERKDGRHVIVKQLIGPVVAKSTRQALKPVVHLIELQQKPPGKGPATWNGGMSWIEKTAGRNAAIVKHAVKDILEGRHLVIPVVRVKHAKELVDRINKDPKIKKKYGRAIAEAFTGKTPDRKQLLKRAIKGKTKCVVGIRSIIGTGINVPKWDTLYEVVPMSNEPNHYQETMRIATPEPGKPTPQVKHFLSNWGAEFGCLRTCMIVYNKWCNVTKKTRHRVNEVLRGRRTSMHTDDDDHGHYKPKKLF